MNKYFNLEILNTFVIATETGKLNVTAELVYRSHSSVSTQIKNLEKQVGTKLFIRQKDTLKLTKNGETLYKYARDILDLNEEAFQHIENENWKGGLTFGVPTDYSNLYLEKIHPKLVEKFPNFHFSTVCSRSRNIRQQIQDGHVQLAIVAMEPQYPDDFLLWEEDLFWVASKNFIHDPRKPLPVALFSDNCIINNHSLYCLKNSKKDFQIVFSSTILNNIVESIHAGIAISLLPASMITKDLTVIPEDFITCPYKLQMGFTWNDQIDKEIISITSEILKSIL